MGKSKDLASGAAYQDQTESDTRYVNTAGDTMTGALNVSPSLSAEPYTSATFENTNSSSGHTYGGALVRGDNQAHLRFLTNSTSWTGGTAKKWQIRVGNGQGQDNMHIYSWTKGDDVLKIDGSGRVTMPSNPVFQAYALSSGSSNTNQVFPNTRINEGNYYSTSTGRFTAPVAGKYLFGFGNIANSTNGTYRYYIRKNGSNVSDHHLRIDTTETGSAYGTNATYTFPLALAASDYVNVFFIESNNGTSTEGGDYAIFWGYLIG